MIQMGKVISMLQSPLRYEREQFLGLKLLEIRRYVLDIQAPLAHLLIIALETFSAHHSRLFFRSHSLFCIRGKTLCESTSLLLFAESDVNNLLQHSFILNDLDELSRHVDNIRCKNGLPSGECLEWTDGMKDPVIIPAPNVKDSSPIYSLGYQEFVKMSSKDMQSIFKKYPVIVVTGRPTRLRCNLESLQEWGDLDDLRVMHGVAPLLFNLTSFLIIVQTIQDGTLIVLIVFSSRRLIGNFSRHPEISIASTILLAEGTPLLLNSLLICVLQFRLLITSPQLYLLEL
jgi:hypothetical protein